MATTSPKPPRISVNDLALYMVSSETAKLAIIKVTLQAADMPLDLTAFCVESVENLFNHRSTMAGMC